MSKLELGDTESVPEEETTYERHRLGGALDVLKYSEAQRASVGSKTKTCMSYQDMCFALYLK